MLAVVAASPALAQSAPVTMRASVGISGFVNPVAPTRIVVDVTATELFVGILEVRPGSLQIAVPVEVPAGTTKTYEVDIPAVESSRTIRVRLLDGDTELVSERLRTSIAKDELLVGVMEGGPKTTLGTARTNPLQTVVTPLDVGTADFGPGLNVLPYLTGPAGFVSGLDEDARNAVANWIQGGGRLVATAADALALDVGPGGVALDGSEATVTRVGAGEIVVVDDPTTLDAAAWQPVLRDVAPFRIGDTIQEFGGGFELLNAATAGSSAKVPALPWLLGGIALFVVLVGPVNFMVLRRLGKPELAWLTVPALSLVFVAGFWFAGREQIDDFTVNQAAVVVDTNLGTTSRGVMTLQTERGGAHILSLPADWSAVPLSFGATSAASTRIEPATDATNVKFDLVDLGVGAVQTLYETEVTPFSAAGRIESGTIHVDVTNESDVTFWTWGVLFNGRVARGSGALAPGDSGSVSVRGGAGFRGGGAIADAVSSSIRFDELGRPDRSYESIWPLSQNFEYLEPSLAPDSAFVFGFTDEYSTPVEVDGRATQAVGVALMAKQVDLDPAARYQLGYVVPQVLSVEGANFVEQYFSDIYAYGADAVYFSYRLPAGGVPGTARFLGGLPFQTAEAYDWQSGEWVPIAWNTEVTLGSTVSAAGDVIVRGLSDGSRGEDVGFNVGQFSMRWST